MTDTGDALAPGTRLEEFAIERVLGAGGFGVTYLAWDVELERQVAVKEYLPHEWGSRQADGGVGPRSTAHAKDYGWGLERFLEEARVLARLDHPHIVRVHRVIKAWGTAYMVTEYVEGRSLGEELKATGPMPESRVRGLLESLASGLESVHAAGLVHRDIKPGNVMLRGDGSPVLIDFGAARQAVGQQSRSVTAVLTPGYAPFEQYSTKGRQGPWTDIYALGAVAYEALSGRVPDESPDRMAEDALPPVDSVAVQPVSRELTSAVTAALSVRREDRPQSLSAWRSMLDGGVRRAHAAARGRRGSVRAGSGSPGADVGAGVGVTEGTGSRRWWLYGTAAAVLAGVSLAVAMGGPWNSVPGDGGGVGGESAPLAPAPDGAPASLEAAAGSEPAAPSGTEAGSGRVTADAGSARDARERVLSPEAVEANLRLDRAGRRLIQEGLVAAGLDPGTPDGLFGAATRLALRQWQMSRGEASTGHLDAAAAAALRMSAEGAARVAAQRQAELDAEAQRQAEARRQAEAQRQAEARRQAETQRQAAVEAEARRQAELRRPGRVFRDCAECPEMVVLAGGGLALGRYEVTVGEYRAFVSATGGTGSDLWRDHNGFPQTDRHPVTVVSWDDAQAYVSWLSRRTGAVYRLPTEAEWARAAAGSQPGCDRLGRGTRPDGTCPVGSYGSNTAGLSDMVGNVWEWTSDCSEGDCGRRVVRGGSWLNVAGNLHPGTRFWYSPAFRNYSFGFRVSRTLD